MKARTSLKLRIVVISIVTLTLAILLAAALLIHNARDAVRAEMVSSMELVDHLLRAVLPVGGIYLRGERGGLEHVLKQLKGTRHVNVELVNGAPAAAPNLASAQTPHDISAPAWFVRAMLPQHQALPNIEIRSALHSGQTLVISADPADEITEIWANVRILMYVTTLALVLLSLLLYLVVRRELRPLSTLANGFERLAQGDFKARIDENAVQELATINRQFNQVSAVLEQSMHDKELLSKRLIYLQEDERRILSRELHDDVGPCFFGIRTDTAISRDYLRNKKFNEIPARLDSIDAIVDQLQGKIRQILQSLRPASISAEELEYALEELVEGWRTRLPGVSWSLDFTPWTKAPDTETASTLYRCVQECLTNIAKHADASQVTAKLHFPPGAAVLLVNDNGQGFGAETRFGLGLIGMRERTQALGGRFELRARKPSGTGILIRIPYD